MIPEGEQTKSAILNRVSPNCGGPTAVRKNQFRCQSRCGRDWRRPAYHPLATIPAYWLPTAWTVTSVAPAEVNRMTHYGLEAWPSPLMPETCTRSPTLIPRFPSRTREPRLARMTFCSASSSPALRSPKYVANELRSEATLNRATTAMANIVRSLSTMLITRRRFGSWIRPSASRREISPIPNSRPTISTTMTRRTTNFFQACLYWLATAVRQGSRCDSYSSSNAFCLSSATIAGEKALSSNVSASSWDFCSRNNERLLVGKLLVAAL